MFAISTGALMAFPFAGSQEKSGTQSTGEKELMYALYGYGCHNKGAGLTN